MNKKSNIIKEIIKLTKAKGEEVFDRLNDKEEQYLSKLLKIIKSI